MHLALRPYVTTGVALVGASAIAVAPIAPTPPDIQITNPAVQLSAAIDPITPCLEVFNDSEVNFASLANEWLEAPLPVLQQAIANQIGYLSELPDFEAIIGQVLDNLQAGVEAPFAADLTTLDPLHQLVYGILVNGIPPALPPLLPADLAPIIALTTTSLSGVLLGLVGPVIAPVLALVASTQAIIANLTGEAPDLETALNTLINVPAAMTGAFLNGGQTLDITPLVSLLGSDLLPEGTTIGVTFGGLLSPGGSVFNALDLVVPLDDILGVPVDLEIPGQGPGAIGSLIDLSKVVARAIGWDGTGNPLAPPLDTSAVELTDTTNQKLVTLDVPDQGEDAPGNGGAENGLPDQAAASAQRVSEVLKEQSPGRELGQLVSGAARPDRPLLNVLKINPLDRGAKRDTKDTVGALGSDSDAPGKHRSGTPVRDLINKVVNGGTKKGDDDDNDQESENSAE
jgi:hypothetical protein